MAKWQFGDFSGERQEIRLLFRDPDCPKPHLSATASVAVRLDLQLASQSQPQPA